MFLHVLLVEVVQRVPFVPGTNVFSFCFAASDVCQPSIVQRDTPMPNSAFDKHPHASSTKTHVAT